MSRIRSASLQDARNAQHGQMKKVDNQINAFVDANRDHLEIWESLDTMMLECQALRTSPSHALLLIKNPELVARQVTDRAGLLDAAKVLAKDVSEYSDKLSVIQTKHAQLANDRKGDPTLSPDVLAALMAIADEYSNWITSYQLVVVPSAFTVTGYFAPASLLAIQPLPDAPAATI